MRTTYVRTVGMHLWELRAPGTDPSTGQGCTRIRTFHALDRRTARAALEQWKWLVIVEGRGDARLLQIAEAMMDELEAPGLAAAPQVDEVLERLSASAQREREIREHRQRSRTELATRYLRARLHRRLTALRDARAGSTDGHT